MISSWVKVREERAALHSSPMDWSKCLGTHKDQYSKDWTVSNAPRDQFAFFAATLDPLGNVWS